MRKAIVVILVAFAFSILGLSFFLDDLYYRTRPREPHPESGQIYPQWIHHSTRVYLTSTERLPFAYSWYAFGAVFVTAYLLNQRWRCFPPFTK